MTALGGIAWRVCLHLQPSRSCSNAPRDRSCGASNINVMPSCLCIWARRVLSNEDRGQARGKSFSLNITSSGALPEFTGSTNKNEVEILTAVTRYCRHTRHTSPTRGLPSWVERKARLTATNAWGSLWGIQQNGAWIRVVVVIPGNKKTWRIRHEGLSVLRRLVTHGIG